MCTCITIHTDIYIYIYICMCVCVCVCVCICIPCTHKFVYIHTYIHTYIYRSTLNIIIHVLIPVTKRFLWNANVTIVRLKILFVANISIYIYIYFRGFSKPIHHRNFLINLSQKLFIINSASNKASLLKTRHSSNKNQKQEFEDPHLRYWIP